MTSTLPPREFRVPGDFEADGFRLFGRFYRRIRAGLAEQGLEQDGSWRPKEGTGAGHGLGRRRCGRSARRRWLSSSRAARGLFASAQVQGSASGPGQRQGKVE